MEVYFVWSDSTATMLLTEYRLKCPIFNISNYVLKPHEIRCYRTFEVCMLPMNEEEKLLAEKMRKELNKYGVVNITKRMPNYNFPATA